MELGREDGSRDMAHTLVAAVVQVDKVLLPVTRQGAGIHSIAMVLACNMALPSGQVEGGDVVGSVTVLQLDCTSTSCQSKQLMAEANTHDGDLGGLHQHLQVVHGGLAVGRVTRAVGDEDAVIVVGNLLNLEVVGEYCYASPAADKASEDVLLDTAVNQRNVILRVVGLNNEGCLGADPLDQVNLAGIDEAFVLVCIILVSNRDPCKRGTLLSQVRDNSTSVNARDGRDAFSRTPFSQALHSGPVTVFHSMIGYNDTGTLDMRRFEVSQQVPLVAGG